MNDYDRTQQFMAGRAVIYGRRAAELTRAIARERSKLIPDTELIELLSAHLMHWQMLAHGAKLASEHSAREEAG